MEELLALNPASYKKRPKSRGRSGRKRTLVVKRWTLPQTPQERYEMEMFLKKLFKRRKKRKKTTAAQIGQFFTEKRKDVHNPTTGLSGLLDNIKTLIPTIFGVLLGLYGTGFIVNKLPYLNTTAKKIAARVLCGLALLFASTKVRGTTYKAMVGASVGAFVAAVTKIPVVSNKLTELTGTGLAEIGDTAYDYYEGVEEIGEDVDVDVDVEEIGEEIGEDYGPNPNILTPETASNIVANYA